MKILFVGGNFDGSGGRESSLITKITNKLKTMPSVEELTLFNGGFYNQLNDILKIVTRFDVVFWWSNVPNSLSKIRDIKKYNPRVLLVASKRNDGGKYSYAQMINRALSVKANLLVEFKKENNVVNFNVFDPLATSWYTGSNVEDFANAIFNRLNFLLSVTRVSTTKAEKENKVPNNKEFFKLVKSWAKVFHKLIKPEKTVTRFLGNSSFRCQRGFPSFKKDSKIYVSKRNVDKRFIDKNNFVEVFKANNKIYYCGEHKPSVDTPVQLELYKHFPNINYMLHSHVYVEGGTFTKKAVPCGALEEVDEILSVIKDKNTNLYKINLIGHGCLIMSSNLKPIKKLKFYTRPLPEVI
jgi:hypothetical protein